MSGTLKLFEDEHFGGEKLVIDLDGHTEGDVHEIPSRTIMVDVSAPGDAPWFVQQEIGVRNKVSSVKWDLPGDVVFTLYEHKNGTGREYTRGPGEGQDGSTHDNDFKDCASSFVWRTVDTSSGHFTMYADEDFESTTLRRYLGEYSEGEIHKLKHTGIKERISSLRWTLPNNVVVTLYENSDGSGRELTRGPGTGGDKSTHGEDFKDCASAFCWRQVDPSAGMFKVYRDKDFEGAVLHRYLSLYAQNRAYSFKGTGMNDRISSVRWEVPPGTTFTLYTKADGTGTYYNRGNGAGRDRDVHNNKVGDSISSFKWRAETRTGRYDQYCYLTAHNAFASDDRGWRLANQSPAMAEQLDGGVRALMLDIWQFDPGNVNDELRRVIGAEDVYLYHGNPDDWSAYFVGNQLQTLEDGLREIVGWLEHHPNEIVTLIFETHVDDVDLVTDAFENSGAARYVFNARDQTKGWSVASRGWPDVQTLAAWGTRLVVFGSDPPNDGMPLIWDYAVESVYGNPSLVGNPLAERSESEPLSTTSKTLFIQNYFPTVPNLGADFMWPTPYDEINRYGDISHQVALYRGAAARNPNFLAVDYFEYGADGGPQRVWSDLNESWADARGHA